MDEKEKAVLKVAKDTNTDGDDVVTLSTGVRARIMGVSAGLIERVSMQIKDPPVPIIDDEETGEKIENPLSPEYAEALKNADRERGVAAMNAMIMFGIEIVDGVPDNDQWVRKLDFLGVNLDDYDLDDPLEREFVYKRFVAVSASDLERVTSRSGISSEEVAQIQDSFPDNAPR